MIDNQDLLPFGQALRGVRKHPSFKWNQAEVGRQIGRVLRTTGPTQAAVSSWELGKTLPSRQFLDALLTAVREVSPVHAAFLEECWLSWEQAEPTLQFTVEPAMRKAQVRQVQRGGSGHGTSSESSEHVVNPAPQHRPDFMFRDSEGRTIVGEFKYGGGSGSSNAPSPASLLAFYKAQADRQASQSDVYVSVDQLNVQRWMLDQAHKNINIARRLNDMSKSVSRLKETVASRPNLDDDVARTLAMVLETVKQTNNEIAAVRRDMAEQRTEYWGLVDDVRDVLSAVWVAMDDDMTMRYQNALQDIKGRSEDSDELVGPNGEW